MEHTHRGYTRLKVERVGSIGWLIFDRPQVANAIDGAMFDELETAWRELDEDDAVSVIVNTGEGASFQTGLDLRALADEPESLRRTSRQTRDAELRLTGWHNQVSKPIIAAVNGTCAGGGLHFVADADVVIATADATFVDPHVSVGQASTYETAGLAAKIPVESVMRMALVGRHERIDATRALQLGLVSEIVDPPERLRDRASEIAGMIARHSPAVLGAIKATLWDVLERGRSEASRQGALGTVSPPGS